MDRRKEGKKERGGYDLDFVFSLLFFPKVISGLDSLGLVISVIYQRVAFGVKFFLGGWLSFEPGPRQPTIVCFGQVVWLG